MPVFIALIALVVLSDIAGVFAHGLWFVTAVAMLAFGAFAVRTSLNLEHGYGEDPEGPDDPDGPGPGDSGDGPRRGRHREPRSQTHLRRSAAVTAAGRSSGMPAVADSTTAHSVFRATGSPGARITA